MSVSKPSMCFWKWFILIKWRNKLLIDNINLTGHRKSACCLQVLVFLEIWVIAPYLHCRTQVFPKPCCHHDQRFVKLGIKVYFFEYYRNKKQRWLVYYLSLSFSHLVKGPLSAAFCNGPVACIINVWGYQHWNTANTTLDNYLLFENGRKATHRRCKVCSDLTTCTTTIDFRLTSVFFLKLEHLKYPNLVLLFIPWKGKCWVKVRLELFVKIIQ